jgi:hypothetical protein
MSTSTSTSTTSIGAEHPPIRIPETPMSAHRPTTIELIIDYATQPSPFLSSFLPEYDSMMTRASRDLQRRNYTREWSCSTIAKLAAGKMLTSPSASEKLRFHLGFVARRVRACRADDEVRCLGPTRVPRANRVPRPGLMTRSLMLVCDRSPATKESEGLDAEGYLRRKPIPLELFLAVDPASRRLFLVSRS